MLFAQNPTAQARLIVAEVTAAHPSTLFGPIEVFGASADLVLANRWGITCNGCGFLNVGRASLVTGTPQYLGTALGSLNIGGGQITFSGSGLHAPQLGSLDLLSGSVSVQAPIRLSAGNSAVIAVVGANQVDYRSGATAPLARAGAVPATVLDVGAAAGMYANQVYLVTTEAGAGVNLRGTLQAGSGGLMLDSNGTLSLAGSQVSAGALVLGGRTVSGGSRMESAGLTLVQASERLEASGLDIKAGDLMLTSGGDLKLHGGGLQARADLRLAAQGTLQALAVPMESAGSATLTSRGDLVLGVTASRSDRTETNGTRVEETRYNRSTVSATAGSVAVQSTEGVVVVDGAKLDAGDAIAIQGLGVALQARKDMTKSTTVSGATTTIPSTETLIGTSLKAVEDISLLAHGTGTDHGNLLATGVDIESVQGHVSLLAARDLDVTHDITTDKLWERFYQVKRKWYGGKEVTDIIKSTVDETVNPSKVSGRTVSMGAGGQLNVVGSAVIADGAVGLHADGDLSLLSTAEEHYAYQSRTTKKSGIFSNGGLSITIGSSSRTEIDQRHAFAQASSNVTSLAGDILATAGNQYLQLSSDLTAPVGDIHVNAKNIAIQSSNDTLSVLNIVRERQSGITLSASHPLISAAQSARDMERIRKRTEDGRYQALALLTSGLTVYNHFGEFSKLLDASPQQAINSFRFNVNLGSSNSDYQSLQSSSTPVESSLNAGRDLTLTATGGGNPALGDTGDVSLVGVRASAGRNMSVSAARDITLAAAVGTNAANSQLKSSSASIGLGFQLNGLTPSGLSLDLAASRSNAWSNGWGTTYFNTELAAAEGLTLGAGQHTTLSGAKASGKKLTVRVGSAGSGNLTLSSPIDEQHYRAREQALGFNASIPIPGLSAGNATFSLTSTQLKLLSDYEAVRQQTALLAGTGGFDVQVAGHTHLQGAVVSSEAAAGLNKLVTRTLSHEDIINRDVATGSSRSVGITSSIKEINNQGQRNIQTTFGGSAVGYARIQTNNRSTTVSGVSAGTLTVTRPDLQVSAVQALRAGQREPLERQQQDLQSQLNQLLLNEPPRCIGCMPWSAPLNPTEQATAAAAATPDAQALHTGANPEWTEWQTAVRTLQAQIAGVRARIQSVDTKVLNDRTSLTRMAVDNQHLANDPALRHQPLLHTFDPTKLTQELKDGVAVTAAFGKAAFKFAGDEADKRRVAEQNRCDSLALPRCPAADAWKNGGTYRATLHAIVGGLAFGQAGAVANFTAQMAEPHVGALLEQAGFERGSTAHNALLNLAAVMVGSASAGTVGAATAFNADANNRQLHPIEMNLITQAAKAFARWLNGGREPSDAEIVAAERRLAQQAFREVQFGVAGANDEAARGYLLNHLPRVQLPGDASVPGATSAYSFRAPSDQRANINMYADLAVNTPELLNFYWRNGIEQPSHAEVVAAFNRDRGQRSLLDKLTKAAGLLAGGIATAPVASWAITACLANISLCGLQAAEIAAGDALGSTSLGALFLARRARTTGMTSAEQANAQWMALKPGNSPPWQEGTAVLQAELAVGTRMRMYVTEAQALKIRGGQMEGLGGWATLDDSAVSMFQVRNQLALPESWKPTSKGLHVVELEVTRPMPANLGFVGPQPGNGTGGGLHSVEPSRYIGGGTQIQLVDYGNRGSYLKLIGQPKCIGGC